MTRTLVALLVLALVPAVAIADPGSYDVWSGAAGKKAGVTIVRQVGKKATTASVSYQCTDAEGIVHSYTAELKGKAKGKKLHLQGTALNGAGTARIDGTLKRKRAKGSFAVSLPQGDDICEVSHTFSVKGHRQTGG